MKNFLKNCLIIWVGTAAAMSLCFIAVMLLQDNDYATSMNYTLQALANVHGYVNGGSLGYVVHGSISLCLIGFSFHYRNAISLLFKVNLITPLYAKALLANKTLIIRMIVIIQATMWFMVLSV